MDIRGLLTDNIKRYPCSMPTDILKLCYQSSFGCGHLIDNINYAKKFFISEFNNTVKDKSVPFVERFGEYARVNFASPEAKELDPERLFSIFIASSKSVLKNRNTVFEKHLSEALKAAKDGLFTFSFDDLNNEINRYMERVNNGVYPPFSHSDLYRMNYHPAYRVIDERYIRLLPLIKMIDGLLLDGRSTIIALEGRAASGKTTAAELLSRIYDSQIISMDDFFLPPLKRTEQRLGSAGENIDYERFSSEVIASIKQGREFNYGVFDCSSMKITKEKHIKKSPLTIIEGVYSTTPFIEDIYDIKVFFDIDKKDQLERLKKRSSNEIFEKFVNLWLVLEEKYYSSLKIKEKCDICIE